MSTAPAKDRSFKGHLRRFCERDPQILERPNFEKIYNRFAMKALLINLKSEDWPHFYSQ